MAFMLPVAIGGITTVGGFVAGYLYASPSTEKISDNTQIENLVITEKDLMTLKKNSPHKKIHKELVEFDKKKLKKADSSECLKKLTAEQEMLERLRKTISTRRNAIDPVLLITN